MGSFESNPGPEMEEEPEMLRCYVTLECEAG